MEVTSYIFQSPYSSAVQVGRPDPLAQKQERQNSESNTLLQTQNSKIENPSEFVQQASSASSVNVAVSTTNTSVSNSLNTFSSLNAQVKSITAFS